MALNFRISATSIQTFRTSQWSINASVNLPTDPFNKFSKLTNLFGFPKFCFYLAQRFDFTKTRLKVQPMSIRDYRYFTPS